MSGDAVLIIDDDEMTRSGLRLLLQFEGYAVQACKSGRSAVDLVEKECFDIFLVDYRMPEMRGDEVTRMLRDRCPGAFIIGIGIESKEETFLQAGADVFLGKQDLTQCLIPLIRNRGKK